MSKKSITFICFILIFFSAIIFTIFETNSIRRKDPRHKLLRLIEQDSTDKFDLTVYYVDVDVSTRAQLSIDDLIKFASNSSDSFHKVVINDIDFRERINYFNRIVDLDLKPTGKPFRVNARFHYIIEVEGNKLFDFTIWARGDDGSFVTLINGVAFEKNCHHFINLVLYLLPGRAFQALFTYSGR